MIRDILRVNFMLWGFIWSKKKYLREVYVLKRFFYFLFNKRKYHKKYVPNNLGENIHLDYVDYQLNFDFNLLTNETAVEYGQAIPYCYYNFAEFRYLRNINNHVMFVMKNT